MAALRTEVGGLIDIIARGVLALSLRNGSSSTIPPYPDETQYALDMVVLACLHEGGTTPPAGVPELIRWCTDLTSRAWSFLAMAEPSLAVPRLVHPEHRTQTRTCAELAGLAQVADDLLKGISVDVSPKEANERRRFVESQVLIGPETHRALLMRAPRLVLVLKSVRDLYLSVPEEWVVRGMTALCPSCGLLALPGFPDDRRMAWCESEVCPPGLRIDRSYPSATSLVLHPALRLFHSLPARSEERLSREPVLTKLGMRPVEHTGSRYRVDMPGGEERIFRVYDRVEPTLLARDAVADQVEVAVVPSGSRAVQPGFREAFADALPDGTQVDLVTDDVLTTYLTNDQKDR
ncbi:hypothetical protein [Actinokineospora inagensis]|uniref:pPIWI_RE_Y domain-containing protein n=1 Tax=Actinokineospora inagensis TaxID=103730 RepID=UPI00047B41FB|nr:hypothetical protein [Actinokineospora inagensis]